LAAITNREELEGWLEGRPREWGQIMALRAAMRVLPLFAPSEQRFDLLLSVFRALFISQAVAIWSNREMSMATARAAYAADEAAATVEDDAVATDVGCAATSAVVAFCQSDFDDGFEVDNSAFAAISFAAAAAVAEDAVIWLETQDDAVALEMLETDANTFQRLLRQSLWLTHAPFGPFNAAWMRMKSELSDRTDENWQFWIDWYESCVRGDIAFLTGLTAQENERFWGELAQESDEFWNREPKFVNQDIFARLFAARMYTAPQLSVIPSFLHQPKSVCKYCVFA